MVKTFNEKSLKSKSWKYVESPAHNPDMSGFDEFDGNFEQLKKDIKNHKNYFGYILNPM